MRRVWLMAAVGLLFALGTVPHVAADDVPPESSDAVPYEAYVAVKVALARSGPGRDAYVTDPLARGDKVQVVDVRDSWVAIRAPDDSFSWVPGNQLRLLKDGKQAEIIADDVHCWVGSNIAEIKKHDYQVVLRRGELVTVLDEKQVAAADGQSSTWVKIRPPSGERRWLQADELTRTRPVSLEKPPASKSGDGDSEGSDKSTAAKGAEPPEDREAGWTDRHASRSGSPRPRSAATPAADRPARRHAAPTSTTLDAEVASLLAIPTDASFSDALTRLQLALTRLVAQGASPEQLEQLERHAAALIRRGESSYQRGQAALLLESVEEFRVLAKRRVQQIELASFVPAAKSETPADSEQDALPTNGTGSSDGALPTGREAATSDSPYLAEGWLMPVASLKTSAPPFVLMDEKGHPVAFVTPAPGVNLRRYIDKEVGLVGQKSFNVFDQPHVVAHRAVELDRHRDAPRTGSAAPWIRFRKATAVR